MNKVENARTEGGGDVAEAAELAVGLEADVLERRGDDDALLQVVGERDAHVRGEAVHGGGALGGLVGNHAADSAPDHLVGSALMEGTSRKTKIIVYKIVIKHLKNKLNGHKSFFVISK